MKLYKIFVLGGLALASLGGTFLQGQAGGGSVVGVIHDPSGAVVPKAEISLTNIDTGASLTTNTSSSGSMCSRSSAGTSAHRRRSGLSNG